MWNIPTCGLNKPLKKQEESYRNVLNLLNFSDNGGILLWGLKGTDYGSPARSHPVRESDLSCTCIRTLERGKGRGFLGQQGTSQEEMGQRQRGEEGTKWKVQKRKTQRGNGPKGRGCSLISLRWSDGQCLIAY